MAATQKVFGQWGQAPDLFIFSNRLTPISGTYEKTKNWTFATHEVLTGAPKLQATGRELRTISFSISLKNIVLLKSNVSLKSRIVGATGVLSLTSSDLDERMFDNIDEVLRELVELGEKQTPLPFFEGDRYEGLYVLSGIREAETHYNDGVKKTSRLELSFLESVEGLDE